MVLYKNNKKQTNKYNNKKMHFYHLLNDNQIWIKLQVHMYKELDLKVLQVKDNNHNNKYHKN
jgi:hypothetical protein